MRDFNLDKGMGLVLLRAELELTIGIGRYNLIANLVYDPGRPLMPEYKMGPADSIVSPKAPFPIE